LSLSHRQTLSSCGRSPPTLSLQTPLPCAWRLHPLRPLTPPPWGPLTLVTRVPGCLVQEFNCVQLCDFVCLGINSSAIGEVKGTDL
jgi:hypothetical protein